MEALTLCRAFGLEERDVSAVITGIFPEAVADTSTVARWRAQWWRSWDRSFK